MIVLFLLILSIPFVLFYVGCYLAKRQKMGWFFSENTRIVYDYLFTQTWTFDTHRAIMGPHEDFYKLKYTNRRLSIWIANGSWFCDLENQYKGTFGYLERHFVFAAIKYILKMKRAEMIREVGDMIRAKVETQ